jgi:hypothetical protein
VYSHYNSASRMAQKNFRSDSQKSKVSNRPPLVIPSVAEGSAVRLARTQKSRESSEDLRYLSPVLTQTLRPLRVLPGPESIRSSLRPPYNQTRKSTD